MKRDLTDTKQKSSHTPGRWKIILELRRRLKCIKGDGKIVCQLPAIDFELEEDRCNARLIAAAPELLKVLKQLSKQIESCEECDGSGYKTDELCRRCHGVGRLINGSKFIDLIESTIARSEGTEDV